MDLVDVLVDARSLPQHMTVTNLTAMLLLMNHGSAKLGGVVLHGHVVPLLHVVGHLAVGVEYHWGVADTTLVHTPVSPVRGPEQYVKKLVKSYNDSSYKLPEL